MNYLLLIPVLLYCIGGIFDAMMDTCSDHFSISVFKNLNPNYWNKNVSWSNKYVNNDPTQGFKRWCGIIIPVALTDAWHLFKSSKEIFNCLALASAAYIGFPYSFDLIILYFVIAGLSRDLVFVIFYDHLLKSKK
jgi:hypothetical protein